MVIRHQSHPVPAGYGVIDVWCIQMIYVEEH